MKQRQTHSGLPQPPGTVVAAVNRVMLVTTALTVATILFIASFYPRALILPAMSELLTLCAAVAVIVAIVRRQPFRPGYFTFWDKALLLMFLSLGAQLLSDPQKVDALLEARKAQSERAAAAITETIDKTQSAAAPVAGTDAAPAGETEPRAPQPPSQPMY